MNHVAALLSMLHEPADTHSATRAFRSKPVLQWTLSRLDRAAALDTTHVLCWDDQLSSVQTICRAFDAEAVNLGPRRARAALGAISAARRWADGWRGGLLGACEFDRGFDAVATRDLAARLDADAVILVDPAAGLVDPLLLDAMVEHAELHPGCEFCFSQAAPGLGGVLLRRSLVDRLTIAKLHPGRMLTYFPDHYGVDPIGKPGCVPVATPVARSTARFTLDTHRQVNSLTAIFEPLNGQLIAAAAEDMVRIAQASTELDLLPRDVTLELNTARHTLPVYSASRLSPRRELMSTAMASDLFQQLAALDDVRVTLAGAGDPLLSPNFFDILEAAASCGIKSVHVETDLVGLAAGTVERLAESPVDIVTVHLPAATPQVYQSIMGRDCWVEAMQNIATLEAAVAARGIGTPLIVPTFTKMAANLSEMEAWYDYWLRRLGHAVVCGATDFAGQLPDPALTDMSPPLRRPCQRIERRLSILCDGSVVSCEQDVHGRQSVGKINESISTLWQNGFATLRTCHRNGEWDSKPLCAACREWHRP